MDDIAVVIPAYRAATSIGAVVRAIPADVRWIVVVDDGGDDDLAGAVRTVGDPRIDLVTHDSNRGVGAAVLSGYIRTLELGAEIIVKLDADGQMDPAAIGELVAPVAAGDADYAKGNRFLHERELRKMPAARRYGNVGLSFFTKLATGYWPVFDPTNGYTAIRGSVVGLLDHANIAQRYFFETSAHRAQPRPRGRRRRLHPRRGQMTRRAADRVEELARWRVLENDARRAALQGGIADAGVEGEEHDPRVRELDVEASRHLEAGHLGHRVVEDDQIGP